MEQIRHKVKLKGPKEALAAVSAAAGGITGASRPGELPRDEKQVSNVRQALKVAKRISAVPGDPADELFVLMQQAKLGDSRGFFIRELKAAPEPAVIVARDYQLQDMVRFCTQEHNFSILTVDPTFCLGDFDVTPMSYRHLLLQSRRTGHPPVFVGPIMIHYRKTFATYLFFASSIIGLRPELEGVQAFGTDGEESLAKAFSHSFSFGLHLTCFIHMRRNIKRDLSDRGLDTSSQNQILDDIFGRQAGSVRQEGLVDCSSVTEFRDNLYGCKSVWDSIEGIAPGCNGGFYEWFMKYKCRLFEESMLKAVRELAHLGSPPAEFSTNACESINAVIKTKVSYKKSDLPHFLDQMKELIDEQEREVERAVLRRGKYELRSEYQHLAVVESRWFRMTEQQRKQHLQRISLANVVCPTADTTHVASERSSTIKGGLSIGGGLSTDDPGSSGLTSDVSLSTDDPGSSGLTSDVSLSTDDPGSSGLRSDVSLPSGGRGSSGLRSDVSLSGGRGSSGLRSDVSLPSGGCGSRRLRSEVSLA